MAMFNSKLLVYQRVTETMFISKLGSIQSFPNQLHIYTLKSLGETDRNDW